MSEIVQIWGVKSLTTSNKVSGTCPWNSSPTCGICHWDFVLPTRLSKTPGRHPWRRRWPFTASASPSPAATSSLWRKVSRSCRVEMTWTPELWGQTFEQMHSGDCIRYSEPQLLTAGTGNVTALCVCVCKLWFFIHSLCWLNPRGQREEPEGEGTGPHANKGLLWGFFLNKDTLYTVKALKFLPSGLFMSSMQENFN